MLAWLTTSRAWMNSLNFWLNRVTKLWMAWEMLLSSEVGSLSPTMALRLKNLHMQIHTTPHARTHM